MADHIVPMRVFGCNLWAAGIQHGELGDDGHYVGVTGIGWLSHYGLKDGGSVWVGTENVGLGVAQQMLTALPLEELVILGGDLSPAEAAEELWLELEIRKEALASAGAGALEEAGAGQGR